MFTGPDVATHDDDIVEAIYACATDEKALPRLLERLAARYSCISAAILFVDPHRPVADVALCQGVLTEEVQARYRAEFAALDPAPKAMALLGAGEATTTDRLYDEDAKRRSASFLDHFYYPLGLRETLGGPFVKTEGRFGVGQGAYLLETRVWDGLSERVMVASYSASRSFRTAAI